MGRPPLSKTAGSTNNHFWQNQEGIFLLEALILMVIIVAAIVLPLSITGIQSKKVVLTNVLDIGLQQAAVAGYVTPEIIVDTTQRLIDQRFDSTDIVITGTTTRQLRGDLVELSLSVPVGKSSQLGLLLIGGNTIDPTKRLVAAGKIMSEYIP